MYDKGQQEAYVAGWEVGRDGGGRAACPYKPTEHLGRAWAHGQMQGESNRRQFAEGSYGATEDEVAKMVADFRADGYGDEPAAVVEVMPPRDIEPQPMNPDGWPAQVGVYRVPGAWVAMSDDMARDFLGVSFVVTIKSAAESAQEALDNLEQRMRASLDKQPPMVARHVQKAADAHEVAQAAKRRGLRLDAPWRRR